MVTSTETRFAEKLYAHYTRAENPRRWSLSFFHSACTGEAQDGGLHCGLHNAGVGSGRRGYGYAITPLSLRDISPNRGISPSPTRFVGIWGVSPTYGVVSTPLRKRFSACTLPLCRGRDKVSLRFCRCRGRGSPPLREVCSRNNTEVVPYGLVKTQRVCAIAPLPTAYAATAE